MQYHGRHMVVGRLVLLEPSALTIKPTIPITHALNMLERYHLFLPIVVCSWWLSAGLELIEVDMAEGRENDESSETKPKVKPTCRELCYIEER